MNHLTQSIIRKWRKQGKFIRFLNGDKTDCRVSNLQYVSLADAMDHIHEWVVDWDMTLTNREKQLVMDLKWRSGLTFN